MPAPDPLTWRCRRDWRCDGRVPARDPETGELLGWEAARPAGNQADGLCRTCVGRFHAALAALPRLLLELNASVGRDQTASPLDPQPGAPGKKKPIPLRTEVEAVRALLDHEACTWARHLGAELDNERYYVAGHDDDGSAWWEREPGPFEWGPGRLTRVTLDTRVVTALAFLRRRADRLLVIGQVLHPLRSIGQHPADGHDPDLTTITGVDRGASGIAPRAWQEQDGIDAAMSLLDIERRADQVCGHSRVKRTSHVPCTSCGWPKTYRFPGDDHWRCERCPATRREDHQDVLLAALLDSRPARTTPRAQAGTR